MKSIKSFDRILAMILLMIAFALLQHKLNFGHLIYFSLSLGGILAIRWVTGAQTLKEAIFWLRSRFRVTLYLFIIWAANLLYIGYSFQGGYVGLIEAVGVYLMVNVVFSAIVLLGQHISEILLSRFERKKSYWIKLPALTSSIIEQANRYA